MMKNRVVIHKSAQKALSRAPKYIQKKSKLIIKHLIWSGSQNAPYPIKPMHGEFRGYYEAVIDKDYRIIFRKTDEGFFIRYAGTHNALGTG